MPPFLCLAVLLIFKNSLAEPPDPDARQHGVIEDVSGQVSTPEPGARTLAGKPPPPTCTPTGSSPSYLMGAFSTEGIHSGGVPTEPCVAVGPRHVLCMGPGNVRIFDKATGALLRSQCQNVFFQTSTGCLSGANPIWGDAGGLNDPDCFFDRMAQRFVALSFSFTGLPNGQLSAHFHIAVSTTSNPLDPWYCYHQNVATVPSMPGLTFFPDRPSLGISADKVAIAAQLSTLDLNTHFNLFRVMNRDSLYRHLVPDPARPDSVPYYDRLADLQQYPHYRLGRNTTADSTMHAVTVGELNPAAATYRSLRGAAAGSVLSDTTNILLKYRVDFSKVVYGPQLGTGIQLLNCMLNFANPSALWSRDGNLTIAWHQPYSYCKAAPVDVIRVLRMRMSRGSNGKAFASVPLDTIYGDPTMWYAFPAVCDDSLGRIYLGFGGSNASMYPCSFVTGRKPGDATIELSPTLVKAGQKEWTRVDGGGHVARWGDFSTIYLDESGPNPVAYYAGEWGKPGTTSGVDTLGTWIRSFYFPSGTADAPPAQGPPSDVVVSRAWPSPSRGRVHVDFTTAVAGRVWLEVDDLSGRRVRFIAREGSAAGRGELVWDGRDEHGAPVASGVYLCRISNGQSSDHRKVVLLH